LLNNYYAKVRFKRLILHDSLPIYQLKCVQSTFSYDSDTSKQLGKIVSFQDKVISYEYGNYQSTKPDSSMPTKSLTKTLGHRKLVEAKQVMKSNNSMNDSSAKRKILLHTDFKQKKMTPENHSQQRRTQKSQIKSPTNTNALYVKNTNPTISTNDYDDDNIRIREMNLYLKSILQTKFGDSLNALLDHKSLPKNRSSRLVL
jgi:hypothetical protein